MRTKAASLALSYWSLRAEQPSTYTLPRRAAATAKFLRFTCGRDIGWVQREVRWAAGAGVWTATMCASEPAQAPLLRQRQKQRRAW